MIFELSLRARLCVLYVLFHIILIKASYNNYHSGEEPDGFFQDLVAIDVRPTMGSC
jgi:hypothetical protein